MKKTTALLGTLIILAVNLICYIIVMPPIEMSAIWTGIGLTLWAIIYLATKQL
jgi:hypothetical protein